MRQVVTSIALAVVLATWAGPSGAAEETKEALTVRWYYTTDQDRSGPVIGMLYAVIYICVGHPTATTMANATDEFIRQLDNTKDPNSDVSLAMVAMSAVMRTAGTLGGCTKALVDSRLGAAQ